MTRHGTADARGAGYRSLFGFLPRRDAGAAAIERLAELLIEEEQNSRSNTAIAAGYTYFGQFIDHDLTFDSTSPLVGTVDPRTLVNLRTPRFDLDSLYGSGPADEPFLYDQECKPHRAVKLLVGGNRKGSGYARIDLPRNRQHRALIGDPRNDENQIVTQLHLLFLRFHNKIVDWLLAGGSRLTGENLFEEARRLVRWHYQWIVRNEFLPKVVGGDALVAVAADRRLHMWRNGPMPLEFSGAAFRFGHSMVRAEYAINERAVPVFSETEPDLRGLDRLPAEHVILWPNFFSRPNEAAAVTPSMRIDHILAKPLRVLPGGGALARLNLQRSRMLELPAGRDIAEAVGERPLDGDELLKVFGDRLDQRTRRALTAATPLWFYILREAWLRGDEGKHLGPVGGRIVAEVLLALLENDPDSYVNHRPAWRPELDENGFTMRDLVEFVGDDD